MGHEYICEDTDLLIRFIKRVTEVTKEGKLKWTTNNGHSFYPRTYKGQRNDTIGKFSFLINYTVVSKMTSVTFYIEDKHKTYNTDCVFWDEIKEMCDAVKRDVESTENLLASIIVALDQL